MAITTIAILVPVILFGKLADVEWMSRSIRATQQRGRRELMTRRSAEVIPGRDRLPWHGCASFLARWLLFSVPRCSCFFSLSLPGCLSSHLSPPALSRTRTRVRWSISPPCFARDDDDDDDSHNVRLDSPIVRIQSIPRIKTDTRFDTACLTIVFIARTTIYRTTIRGTILHAGGRLYRSSLKEFYPPSCVPLRKKNEEHERRENYRVTKLRFNAI